MKNKLLAMLVIILLGNVSLSFTLPHNNKTDIQANETQSTTLNPNNILKLAEIEQYLFGKIFSSKNLNNRLSRVEKRLFYTTYTNLTDLQRLDNIISNYNKYINSPNLATKSIKKLEKKVLGAEYEFNTPEERVERLEEKVFGAVQTGDLNSRIKSLEIAWKNSNNTSEDIFETKGINNSGWNFIGGSSFSGYPTGISPALTTYTGSYPTFNNLYNPYRPYNRGWNSRWSHGYPHYAPRHIHSTPWGNTISRFGTGSRVTILP